MYGTFAVAEQKDEASYEIAFEFELDEILVEEQGPMADAQIGDVFLEYDTSFHSVIKRDQFEGKMTDVAQVISQHSPVQIRSNGGLGSFSTLSLRGSSGARLPIYIDGILQNDNSTGGVDLTSLTLGQIEQIEVYRGIVPMAFSQASIAGAINIRTRRLNKPTATVSLGTGSFNTYQFEASAVESYQNWDYSISGSHQQSKNNYPYRSNNGTEHNTNDDFDTSRNHNGFTQNNIQLKVQSELSESNRIIIMLEGSEQNKQLPTWNNFQDPGTTLDKSSVNSTVKWLSKASDALNFSTLFGLRRTKLIYSDRLSSLGIGSQVAEYITEKGVSNFYLEHFWRNYIFSYNTELSHEVYKPNYLIGTVDYADSSRTTANLGVQSQSFHFDNKLIVVPAVRVRHYMTTREKSFLYESLNATDTDYGLQLGLQWIANNTLKFKNNWSRYHRVPTFLELYSDAGLSKGNPELLSESGFSFDIGLESKHTFSEMIKTITFSGSIYQTNIDNVITWIYNSQGIGLATNISKSQMQGVELQLDIDFNDIFSLYSMLNVNSAKIIEGPNSSRNKQIPGHALVTTNNHLFMNFKRHYQLKLEANAEIGKYYDSSNQRPIEDQFRLNLSLAWINKNWRSDLTFNNLLNQMSEDYYSNPLPGRAFYLTFRYTI